MTSTPTAGTSACKTRPLPSPIIFCKYSRGSGGSAPCARPTKRAPDAKRLGLAPRLGPRPPLAGPTRPPARPPQTTWAASRARVETEGWGAALLSNQDPDGQWTGAAFWPKGLTSADWAAEGQPWTATSHILTQLREFGLPPASPHARAMTQAIGRTSLWEQGDQPFWQGETQDCINGRTLADGCYFGVDMSALATRLLTERQPDGGWNCERCNGSHRSSYHSRALALDHPEGAAGVELVEWAPVGWVIHPSTRFHPILG